MAYIGIPETPGKITSIWDGKMFISGGNLDSLAEFPSYRQKRVILFEHYMLSTVPIGWTGSLNVGGSQTVTNGLTTIDASHPWTSAIGTGAGASGSAAISSNFSGNTTTISLHTSSVHRIRTDIKMGTSSTNAQNYTIRMGLSNAANTVLNDGTSAILFKYNHNVYGGNWECCTISSSVSTSVNSGIPAAPAGTANSIWEVMEIQISSNLATASFAIDGSIVATISSTILTGSSLGYAFRTSISKSAGTIPSSTVVGYMGYRQDIINNIL